MNMAFSWILNALCHVSTLPQNYFGTRDSKAKTEVGTSADLLERFSMERLPWDFGQFYGQ